MSHAIQKIFDTIKDLIQRKFYGKLTLTFYNGKITFMKKEETTRMD
jgi:hypothetical protein